MLFNIIAPEVILAKAIGEFLEARYIKKEIDELAKSNEYEIEEWSLTHSFFLFLGGFRIMVEDESLDKGTVTQGVEPGQGTNVKDSHNVESHAQQNTAKLPSNVTKIEYVVCPKYLIWLLQDKQLQRFPGVTKEEILDKSKADTFVKALSVIQIFWVCLEVIVRSTKSLAVTQLELSTAAFCVCTILTYIFVIPKPQSVGVPLPPFKISQSAHEALMNAEWNARNDDLCLRDFVMRRSNGSYSSTIGPNTKRVPNDYLSIKCVESFLGYYFGMIVGCVVFNGIHLAAWNFKFPTPTEQLLWHAAGIVATTLFPLSMVVVVIISMTKWAGDDRGVSHNMNLICGMAYVLARLFLLVETFRSLAFHPPDTFKATWMSNLPSIV